MSSNERESLKIYFEQIKDYPLLSREQEVSLHKKLKSGCEASKELFVSSNLRWVITIARKNTGRGVDLEDLIQHGNFGLLRAVEKFQPDLGYKFSTYSMWWIKQAITRAIHNHSRTIRLPIPVNQFVAKMMKSIGKLQNELQKENVTEKEIIDNTDFRKYDIRKLNHIGNTLVTEPSLNLKDDSDVIDFMETVSYDGVETPESNSDDVFEKDIVTNLLGFLSDRDRRILAHRFGLFEAEELTLEEIGDIEGVSRERVRQLQNLALSKMKQKAETYNLTWR